MTIAMRWLLLLVSALTALIGSVHGTPKELVVSYHACTEGQGCHVMDQVTFHDSHILMLTSANHQSHPQGRIVDLDSGCPRTDSPKYAGDSAAGGGNGHHGGGKHGGRHPHRTVGLVRCGTCPLSDMLHEAAGHGVGGVLITNTKQCGRPTDEFVELTTSLGFPVTFVSDKVA
ncbi:hypothetical protein GGF44_006242, partial [Coemansia sp. RSA 1694]